MTLKSLLLSVLVSTTALAQAPSSFIGTWVLNDAKSPKTPITYAIKDLGPGRYALTGSTGETTEVKADGTPTQSPSHATVSFKKLDAHTWHMDRTYKDDPTSLARTYTVSADDTKLTLTDVFTGKQGFEGRDVTQYHRTSPGKSIYGEWKSFSMERTLAKPSTISINRLGSDGLSITYPTTQSRTDIIFDGKPHPDHGPKGPLDTSTASKRVNPHLIQLESRTKDVLDETQEYKLSEDGKTLTITSKELKSSAVFTTVWDKK
jgi:hypothetical protein